MMLRQPVAALGISLVLLVCPCRPLATDQADSFFDDTVVREIHLEFANASWYNTLYAAHANDPEDPYFPASFSWQGTRIDAVGVRFKGNSSFGIAGPKKSFKIDFNRYDEEGELLGMTKLNLNNSFKDPSMLRAKLFLDFAGAWVPTIRACHVKVYVNGSYWGLYLAVEQIDRAFTRSRFGDDEDGDLFKGAASDDAGPQGDFGSDLSWLGNDPAPYHDRYQLKTNEADDDYSQLVEFIDILNNVPVETLAEELEEVFDVSGALAALALNNLFVNLDSYSGSAHNYYLYDRDADGRLCHLHWDANEAFGRFLMGVAQDQDPLELDPFWLPQGMMPNQPSEGRPLMERLWSVPAYRTSYLRFLAAMLRGGFDGASFDARVSELADRIRPAVIADPHAPYSTTDFETSLTSDLGIGNATVYGLSSFVDRRRAYLEARLDAEAAATDLRLNEVMTRNLTTVADQAGDFDPWLEIVNLGPGRVATGRLYLSDDADDPTRWALPDGELDDGQYLLVWLDGETGDGADHASFAFATGGGELLLSVLDGDRAELIDQLTVPAMDNDRTWVRTPDGEGEWSDSDRPTPGASNLGSSAPLDLRLNELMADNDTTLQDPDGNGGYPDWFEIHNPGSNAVELGGLCLSDAAGDPCRWRVPGGVSIAGGGFLLLWADNDEDQGPTHASFALDADGDELVLSTADGATVIDAVSFAAQAPDRAYGRSPDGSGDWSVLAHATPGATNCSAPRRAAGRRGTP